MAWWKQAVAPGCHLLGWLLTNCTVASNTSSLSATTVATSTTATVVIGVPICTWPAVARCASPSVAFCNHRVREI
jgi:hypothetical protein